ncbi:MAG: hypothetical protein P4M03_25240 [Cupriavidus basilensis]|nr:hypothetical protein [Cupriavidus basilensis]MDR3383756.1 hypothetical protein [Cupriavidus basilensis]
MKFGLLAWVQNPVGLVAMIGVVFACGLPGWATVRWLFNVIERRRELTVTTMASLAKCRRCSVRRRRWPSCCCTPGMSSGWRQLWRHADK